MNFRQIKAIEQKNKERILKICPQATEESGIYIFTRFENDYKFGYVGQAKHLLTRLASYLKISDRHINRSIKTHKLWSEENPTGWQIEVRKFAEEMLNEREQYFIKLLANKGYQLRNKTSGSQGEGKFGIAENKPSKGYYDGLKQGHENARKNIAKLFAKNLMYTFQGEKTNKNKEKAMAKFEQFLRGEID